MFIERINKVIKTVSEAKSISFVWASIGSPERAVNKFEKNFIMLFFKVLN